MKKIFAILIFSCIIATTQMQAQGRWTKLSDFGGTGRQQAVGFSINGKGYMGTGYDGNAYRKDFWEFDPVTNSWAQKADFGGVARSSAVGFAVGGKGYIGTGELGSQQYTKDFWEYDPIANTWLQRADFGGTARAQATGFGLTNKGYIGTGVDINNSRKDFWEYDPTLNIWVQKSDFGGTKRINAVGLSLGNKGYIGTGSGLQDFWEYDPLLNSWVQKANFGGGGREAAAGFSIGNKAYIATGSTGASVWEWDSNTNLWSQKTDYGGGNRNFAVGFSIGNKGYLGLGGGNTWMKDFWEFDPTLCPIVASFNISANNVYMGQTATFTGTSIGTITSRTWLADGVAFANTVNASKSFSSSGIHTITLIVNGACSDTITKTITILGGAWVEKAELLGEAREGATGFSIGNKAYIATGSNKNDLWEWDPATNVWSQKADLPAIGRRYAVSFVLGNKGYLGTGMTSNNSNLKDFWEYDPLTNAWAQKADFGGTARKFAVAFSCINYGYILTGNDGTRRKDFWEYDPITDIWVQKPDFAGAARERAVGFSIGQKGYIGTGTTGSGELKEMWEWDQPTNTWLQRANFPPVGRVGAVGFSLNGKGIVGTGYGNGSRKSDFWEFNPSLNGWTQLPGISITREHAVAFSLGGRGYVGTGLATSNTYNESDFWEYNPNNCGVSAVFRTTVPYITTEAALPIIGQGNYMQFYNFSSASTTSSVWQINGVTFASELNNTFLNPTYTFNQVGTFEIRLIASNGICSDTAVQSITVTCSNVLNNESNFPGIGRKYCVGFNILNKGYVGMGYHQNINNTVQYLNDFWEYDASSDSWTQKASLPASVRFAAVGFSIGSKGYVGTGIASSNVYKKDFWEYDPVSNAWTQKADFGGVGRGHAVGFSISNKGYIGTGGTSSTLFKDFWEYDPVNDVWTQKANFGGVARQMAVGFAIGGLGYIGTGDDNPSSYLASAEDMWEYNPVSDSWQRKKNLPEGRLIAFCFATSSKAYVGDKGRLFEFTPAQNLWIIKDSIPFDVNYQGWMGFTLGNKGYFGLGIVGGQPGHNMKIWSFTLDTCILCTPSYVSFNTTICSGNSITIGQHTYSSAGTYIDTLTTYNGCDSIVTTSLTVNPLPIATISSNGSTSFCEGLNVILDGGSGFATYLWSNGDTTQTTQVSTTQNNYVIVTDTSGCKDTSSVVSVVVAPAPNLIINNPPLVCATNTVDISLPSITLGSSAGVLTYWLDSLCQVPLSQTFYTAIDSGGVYYIRIDSSGCTTVKPVVVTFDNDCVWPGDTNKDSLVNNYDILPVGLYYSQNGIPRSNVSNAWQPNIVADWGINQSNNADIKHVDCDGNGIIDNNDTLAINQNFSSIHNISGFVYNQERTTDPDMYFVPSVNTYYSGDWVNVEVWLGKSINPVNNLYGIAFDINYDGSLIQSGTESINITNSWLGTVGVNTIKVERIDNLATAAYAGVTRINHTNASGYGKIADFKFQINTSLVSPSVLNLSFLKYKAIDAMGTEIVFNSLDDSLIINQFSTNVLPVNALAAFTIAPNPFNLQTSVTFNEEQSHTVIQIVDMLGKEVKTIDFSGKELVLYKEDMNKGMYYLKLKDKNNNAVNRKIIVQ
jgi:N-acetylneuraminic acid mutarotase